MDDFDRNLERISNILQILSYQILVSDFNNTDLMQYLKHQDDLLSKIINQKKLQWEKEETVNYRFKKYQK